MFYPTGLARLAEFLTVMRLNSTLTLEISITVVHPQMEIVYTLTKSTHFLGVIHPIGQLGGLYQEWHILRIEAMLGYFSGVGASLFGLSTDLKERCYWPG